MTRKYLDLGRPIRIARMAVVWQVLALVFFWLG